MIGVGGHQGGEHFSIVAVAGFIERVCGARRVVKAPIGRQSR